MGGFALRFAVIGSNFIADWFVAAAEACEGLTLHTAYSRTHEQAALNAQKWGFHSASHDLDALALDPEIDAVYIASPNACHFDQVKRMLLGGKHVLCEKPLVPSASEFETLLTLAQSRDLLLLEAMRPAHLPGIPTIKEHLPLLGTLRYAEFPYAQYSSRYQKFCQGIVENAFDPTFAGGALLDIGIYCIHWMAMLFGEPDSIRSAAAFLDYSIDINGMAICEYGSMQAVARYSKAHYSDSPAVIEGENGCLTLSPFPIPQEMKLYIKGKDPVTLALDTGQQDMRYEIQRFIEMAAHPLNAVDYQTVTLQTLRITDKIRAQNDIDFQKKKRNETQTSFSGSALLNSHTSR